MSLAILKNDSFVVGVRFIPVARPCRRCYLLCVSSKHFAITCKKILQVTHCIHYGIGGYAAACGTAVHCVLNMGDVMVDDIIVKIILKQVSATSLGGLAFFQFR